MTARFISPRQRALAAVCLLVVLVGLACAPELKSRVSNGHTLTTAGIIAYYEGELKSAERLLRSAVNHDYSDTLARYYLAKAYVARGGTRGRMAAEEVLGDLTAMARDEPLYLITLAQLRLRQGYRSNARRALDRLLVLEPDDISALFEVGRLSEGDWWRFQAERDRRLALRYYRRVLEVDPTHREANTRMAVIALEADSLELARQHVDELLEHHPGHSQTQLLEGVLLEYAGDFEAAQTVLQRAIEALPAFDRGAFDGPTFLEPDSTFSFGPMWGGLEIGQNDLDDDGRFWRQRDPTPGTPVNERFVVHASRTAMADFLYGDPQENVRGWETAPGEFYIRYGKPVRRDYAPATAPVWFHTFDVGGQLVTMRFYDYSLNGSFMLPIEYDASPLHAELRLRRPENAQLEERLPVVSLAHTTAWYRTSQGEPRLQVTVASEHEAMMYEAAILDTSWKEIYRALQLSEPRLIPDALSIPAKGLFDYTFYPGADAARLEITLGETRTVSARLGPSLPRTGFAVSDLVVGYSVAGEFYPNPNLPIRAGSTIAVDFEVYAIQLDALGVGYLELTLSIIPRDRGGNRGLSRLLRGAGDPAFVATAFQEEVATRDWQRRIEIDTSELDTGNYTIRLEVADTITGDRVTRERNIFIASW